MLLLVALETCHLCDGSQETPSRDYPENSLGVWRAESSFPASFLAHNNTKGGIPPCSVQRGWEKNWFESRSCWMLLSVVGWLVNPLRSLRQLGARQWSCQDQVSPALLCPRFHSFFNSKTWSQVLWGQPCAQGAGEMLAEGPKPSSALDPPHSARLREQLMSRSMRRHSSCTQALSRGSCREEAELQPPQPGRENFLASAATSPSCSSVYLLC